MSNIAVRILHTHYDYLSLLAKNTHQRIHTPSHRYLLIVHTPHFCRCSNANTNHVLLGILDLPHLFGSRSLVGDTEFLADVDTSEVGETKGEGEEKEDKMQQQMEDVQTGRSIQGSEGRKVS